MSVADAIRAMIDKHYERVRLVVALIGLALAGLALVTTGAFSWLMQS